MSKDKEFTGSKTIKQNTKMKKRIFGAALLVAIAVAAGWNYQQNKQDVQLSDLALENVEALASCEELQLLLVRYRSVCCDAGDYGCSPCDD